MFPKKALRLAIAGVRGIGQVHARIFHELGANVCAVLASSKESAAEAAQMLKKSFGIHAQPFSCFKSLLSKSCPEAVSICTPPSLHYGQIMAAFDHRAAVFCEKPLLWHEKITRLEIERNLERIKNHPHRRLFVNTSNANFIDRVMEKIGKQKNIHSFLFRFYTQGAHLRHDIAVDLLPHGLSLLLHLFSPSKIKNLKEKIRKHNYFCSFNYGNCRVEFDFQEVTDGPKMLSFSINEKTFTRIQRGSGRTYQVYLKETNSGDKIKAEDPFRVYIKRFLKYCKTEVIVKKDEFDEAAFNLRLMADILFGEKNG